MAMRMLKHSLFFIGMNSSMGMGPMPAMPSASFSKTATTANLLKPAELFAMLKGLLNEDIVNKVDAVFQFNLSGPDGGSWCLDIRNGNGYVGTGKAPCDPDVTISMTASDFQSMFYGRLSPGEAYMVGKISLEGDVYATSRLEELLNSIREQQSVA